MDWKLHVIVSMTLYVIILSFMKFSFMYSVQAALLLAFASLLPDIDHPRSVIRKLIFVIVFYAAMFFVIIETNFDVLMKIMLLGMILILCYYVFRNLPLSHRGKKSIHRWRYVIIAGMMTSVLFAIWNINISLSLFIIIGYASHMIADKIKIF